MNIDAYAALAERNGLANSVRNLRVLEFLMTLQQAHMATDLPPPPDEIALRLGKLRGDSEGRD
jgi:hypothetical protein